MNFKAKNDPVGISSNRYSNKALVGNATQRVVCKTSFAVRRMRILRTLIQKASIDAKPCEGVRVPEVFRVIPEAYSALVSSAWLLET